MKKNNSLLHPFSLIKHSSNNIPKAHPSDNYRTIIENSNQAFILSTTDGTILETNKAANLMFGYTTQEFLQLKRWHIIDHTDEQLLQSLKNKEENKLNVIEATGIKSNAALFSIEFSKVVFKDILGEDKCSMMISDISTRKKAEKSLLLSDERFDQVVKATKTMVWDWDLLTDEIYRNSSGLWELLGQQPHEYFNTVDFWLNNIHPEDRETTAEKINYFKNSKTETEFSLEYRFKIYDGTYIFINDKGRLIRNKNGKVIRMIGAAENITDRKQNAITVEKSEQRYKMFLKHSTEGIWRIELAEPIHINTAINKLIEHCYQHASLAECNDAFAKMYGYNTASEMIGIPLHQMLPNTNPLNYDYFVKFFTEGFKVQDELSYEHDVNGNELIFSNNMIGIIENDYVKRAWGTQKDITEQKKAERALAESENRLRAIVQTDPECIKLLSKEGIVLEMNPAGLEMVEADNADQVLGINALKLVLPKYQDAFKKSLDDVFNGKKVKLVFEICGFKGRKLFMESHCVPLKNETGSIIALLAVTRDITESKNAQFQLMASEERYRSLFNNNPASIIIWEMESLDIIEVNDTAINLYGYSREEFLQFKLPDLSTEKDQDKLISLLNRTLSSINKVESSIWYHTKKDGSRVTMEITPHKIIYKGRQAVLTLATNITERIFLENSLAEERQIRHQQITEAVIAGQENERTELGQELHDNINQILASTKLYIECAMNESPPRYDLMKESKALVEKAMVEIRNLSKSLLPPSLGEIGLLQALQELVASITEVNNLKISVEWDGIHENELNNKLKLTIFRIVQEQLSNIVKHAEACNAVVSIKKEESIFKIVVKDDGLGFNTQLKRNGVGLRNISSRAEVNNGTVSLLSAPGEGCELIVCFPETKIEKNDIVEF